MKRDARRETPPRSVEAVNLAERRDVFGTHPVCGTRRRDYANVGMLRFAQDDSGGTATCALSIEAGE
jgi:hypothetical protein